jgi:splicing factor 3B subunit 1
VYVTVCCVYDGHVFGVFMLLMFKCLVQLVDTTVEIVNKVGASEIISHVVDELKDKNEQYRKMVMETIEKITENLGAADIDSRLEEQFIHGILYAFQDQTTEVI